MAWKKLHRNWFSTKWRKICCCWNIYDNFKEYKYIYKYITSISQNLYIYKLVDIVGKYNNKYYESIRMSPVNVKSNTYINSSKETSNKDPKFKTGDIVRLSIWKNIKIFLKKVTLQIDLKNFLWLKELKKLYRGH